MMSTFYNNMKTVVLMAVLTGIVLFLGQMIGGQQGLVVALVMAGAMNVVAFFFSDKIAIASMRAYEVGPDHDLYQIVAGLAARAGLPMPRVYVSPTMAPNAFATGRSPSHAAVCATEGLLQMLNRNEVAGVMAHELAHVKHRDILTTTVAATIAAAIGYLGYFGLFGGRDRDTNPLLALLGVILAPVAAGLVQAAISRSREYNADKVGAEIAGDPMYLATALEKIHLAAKRVPMDVNPAYNSLFIAEPLSAMGENVATLFSTHPPLEKRLQNLIGRESTGTLRNAW